MSSTRESSPHVNVSQLGVVVKSESPGPNAVENGHVTATSQMGTPQPASKLVKSSVTRRIEVDTIMVQFQKGLGHNWDRYRDVLTQFLTGKLSRTELQREMSTMLLTNNMVQMHNQFLLANLANSLRDGPNSENGTLSGWAKRSHDGTSVLRGADSSAAKVKDDILSLSVRERKRIKAIAKDTSKQPSLPSTVTATRQALLPKIPFVNQETKDKSRGAGARRSSPSPQIPTSNTSGSVTHANPATWTQDIIAAYDAPLASELYELPDQSSLTSRMLGICLEHGIIQGIEAESCDIMIAGLEHFLKDILEQILLSTSDSGEGNESNLTAEDILLLSDRAPTTFVEIGGPMYAIGRSLVNDNLTDSENDDNEENIENDQFLFGYKTESQRNLQMFYKQEDATDDMKNLLREAFSST